MKGNHLGKKLKMLFRLRFLLPVSLGVLIAAVATRIIQLFVAVDFTTGFFKENSFWVPLLTVLLVLFSLYGMGQALCNRFSAADPYQQYRLKPLGAATMLLGVVMLLSGFAAILQSAGDRSDARLLVYITILLEIAAGGAFLYHGFLLLQQEIRRLKRHVLMLVPAIWSAFRLITNFIAHTTIASISEYLFDILFDAAVVLFLFYFARFTAGLRRKHQERFLLLFGLLTVMLGAVSTMPPLFFKIFAATELGQQLSWPDFSALLLTVFVGWMLVFFIKSWIDSEETIEERLRSVRLDCEYQYETVGIEGLFRR